MHIDHVFFDGGGALRASRDGIEAGTVHYSYSGTYQIIIDSARVHPAYSGEGVADRLISEVVDFARTNNLSVIPECSYSRKVFQCNPQYSDVLYESRVVEIY